MATAVTLGWQSLGGPFRVTAEVLTPKALCGLAILTPESVGAAA